MNTGKYIVLEGGEGVGKTTQAELIISQLSKLGIEAILLHEPGGTEFALKLHDLIKHGPERTPLTNVMAFNAARAEAMHEVRQRLDAGQWVIADRSYLSTIAYQGYGEGLDLETIRTVSQLAINETTPDVTLVLELPATEALIRMKVSNPGGDYFEDMASQFHDRVREGYRIEAELQGIPIIDANGTQEKVFEKIWEYIEPLLKDTTDTTTKANQGLVNSNGKLSINAFGKRQLSEYITNTDDEVYVFNGKMSSSTIAAAMARLSRRGDDMRITLLDEFLGKEGKDEALLHRVITAYGDDSVQQLVGVHAVVEGASNLLTKYLEWGRLAAYLEQSTRYIYFDEKDENDKYKYFTPRTLDPYLTDKFDNTIRKIFEIYSDIVHKLTDYIQANSSVDVNERDGAWRAACRAQACDAARPLLPVATKSTVGIYASGQALESLIMHLQSEPNEEANRVGDKLLSESRKVIPVFLERADKPDRGGASVAYRAETKSKMLEIANQNLPAHSLELSSVELIDVSMRNELDLIPYMLYESSALSLEELRAETDKWSIERKISTFQAYIGERLNRRHKPGRALEHINYTWDLICDYGIFRDLQRHRIVSGLEWQLLTPRYGYEIPKIVDDAGLGDDFEKGFDLSLDLYNELESSGFRVEAQYATLLGHKMRWKISYNAREAFHIHELRTSPQGHPGYRKLVNEMHQRLSEVHPLLGQAMHFVNSSEDPELARLAAEKYSQFKLSKLNSKNT